jgi:hypothetical protein
MKLSLWRVIGIAFILAGGILLLTLGYNERISSGGLVPLYQGPTYTGYGLPLWYLKIYEEGSYTILWLNLLFDFSFWFLASVFFLSTARILITLARKFKDRSTTQP